MGPKSASSVVDRSTVPWLSLSAHTSATLPNCFPSAETTSIPFSTDAALIPIFFLLEKLVIYKGPVDTAVALNIADVDQTHRVKPWTY
jgi:hypothetical protein